MDLSKAVGTMALILAVVLATGYAMGSAEFDEPAPAKPAAVKSR